MCSSMQHSPEDLKDQLLACIDEDCNVQDMASCLSVISLLEQASITRKILEDTRLGKYVNDIRRQTTDHDLSKRLKNLVRKWRDTCQAESMNGIAFKGPGPGGGDSSQNGRYSISPPFSAPNSIKSHTGSCLSPCSLPSSGNTSPQGKVLALSTPSTTAQKLQNLSPRFCVAKNLYSGSALQSKSNRVSPICQPISPFIVSSHSQPTSPHLSKSSFRPIVIPCKTRDDSTEITYIPSVENVPRTNAANKRLRKCVDGDSDLPPSKKFRNSLINGFDDECSVDSLLSIVSSDHISQASGDGAIEIVAENVQTIPEKTTHRSGRKRKSAYDVLMGSNIAGNAASIIDPLRQKMAVVNAQNSKVKTTSQLVAELAQRSGDETLAKRANNLVGKDPTVPDRECFSQNKKDHMERFLKSQFESVDIKVDDDDDIIIIENESTESELTSTIDPSSSNPTPILLNEVHPCLSLHSNHDSPKSNIDLLGIGNSESAEEILARLPPVDANIIDWEDCLPKSYDVTDVTVLSEADTVRNIAELSNCIDHTVIDTLHHQNLDCQNGNFDLDGRFREWHEVIHQKAYQDTPIILLPYVISDF